MISEHETKFTNPNDIDDDSCLNYAYKVLRKYRDQNLYYQDQLEESKQRLDNNFTDEIEETIVKFVEEHGISLLRVPIEGKIATVEYEFKDRLIELEFYDQSPHPYQVSFYFLIVHLTIFSLYLVTNVQRSYSIQI